MNKAGSLFEVVWFVMGGLLLFIGIEQTIDPEIGIADSWYYFAFALLALLMYYRRRRIRLASKK